jgi:glycosyltransferase involved in cell wall biosynthesis
MIETLSSTSLFAADETTSNAAVSSRRWLHAVSHLDPKYGGVSAVVPQLGASLARAEGLTIDIASFSARDESYSLGAFPELSGTHWPASRASWILETQLRTRFSGQLMQADGLHVHGLWETHTSVATHIARSLRKPYILSAHGMLEPWALANKGLKKRLYSAFIERNNIENATCLHALTLAEADDYRRFGSRRPIAVIPNGVMLPATVDSSLFLDAFPTLRKKRVVLFLGRMHVKKGIDLLVKAWADVARRFPDAVLVLAGPDCENTRATIESMVEQYGLSDHVVFTGMLAREMKWSALASAHSFVLPSYSEGLSVAVLEAMEMGLPVIVSDRCHLPEVEQYGTGWQIAANVPELTRVLEQMLSNSAVVNAEIGNRGRRLVYDRFAWPVVAAQMAELYRWVLGGPRPRSFALLEVAA